MQSPYHAAAGLLEGTKFHGRTNPLLGPGLPPQDDYDPPSTREHHKGWHPMHSHLLQKRSVNETISRNSCHSQCMRPSVTPPQPATNFLPNVEWWFVASCNATFCLYLMCLKQPMYRVPQADSKAVNNYQYRQSCTCSFLRNEGSAG